MGQARMRTVLRVFLWVVGVLALLMSAAIVRSTVKGTVVWYVSIPNVSFQTDGKPSNAWLHQETKGRPMILTRRVNQRHESYLITPPTGRRGGDVSPCGQWTAPRLPVFPVPTGGWEPLYCFEPLPEGQKPPAQDVVFGMHSVSFNADDGSRITARWK